MNEFENMDGEVIDFEVMPGSAKVSDMYDNENFYPFDGDEFSYAIGDRLRSGFQRLSSNIKERKDRRQDRRDTRVASKADARTLKAESKLTQAEASREAAKGLADPSADIALANAMASQGTPKTEGMSTGVKIAIGIGALAVVGTIAYFLMKKKK